MLKHCFEWNVALPSARLDPFIWFSSCLFFLDHLKYMCLLIHFCSPNSVATQATS